MSQNIMLTWALRFAGWLLMFIGFSCLTRFLTSLGNVYVLQNLNLAYLCQVKSETHNSHLIDTTYFNFSQNALFTTLFISILFPVDSVPIIRELVTLGVASLNLTLSISFSLTVIALGWIR